MKKTNKTNLVVRTLVILTIMSFFMFGCGKTEVATDTTEKEDVVVEVPETTTEVEEPQKEESVEAVEPEVEEEPVVEEPAEEPLANEIIMNSAPIADWVSTLEEEDVKFIIYNDVEGYKQILNDGETYHMKKDDKIFLYRPSGVVTKCRLLTLDVRARTGEEVNTPRGYSVDIGWKDMDVVTYGEELTMEEYPEPKSVTCIFYKATE